ETKLLETKLSETQAQKTNLIKSKQKEIADKVAELRQSKEKMEQLYKEQLVTKDKEKEEIISNFLKIKEGHKTYKDNEKKHERLIEMLQQEVEKKAADEKELLEETKELLKLNDKITEERNNLEIEKDQLTQELTSKNN
ncbi:13150_t:CDS:2, partial [Gigaspora margarita]